MTSAETRSINLALQGGGAHGAFTWGVLDRLLEDERIVIEGISGTSAGAMNAAILAAGYAKGGRDGARTALRRFWEAISESPSARAFHAPPWEKATGSWTLDTSPTYLWFDLLSRLASPYQLNPVNHNPLRVILESHLDTQALCEGCPIQLCVCATNVRTGRVRVFRNHEVNTDSLLASACLPQLFQGEEIDGDLYWDGGFLGNPAIFPLYEATRTEDIVLVEITPLIREERPTTAREIINRMNEISFNSSLMYEMRAIAFVRRLLAEQRIEQGRYRRILMHSIHAEAEMRRLGASSKFNAEWEFLDFLHGLGRRTADAWLAENYRHLGERDSVDVRTRFL